jgi:hypothetical protein
MSGKTSKLERLHERQSVQVEKEIALLDKCIMQKEEIDRLKGLLKQWRVWYEDATPRSQASDLFLKTQEIV